MADTLTDGRAKLDFSFDDNDYEEKKEEVSKKIEEISKKSGFNSVSPAKKEKPKKTSEPIADESIKVDRRARMKTGRTYAFNTKIKPSYYQRITELSDKMSEKEGRYVPIGEVIERAIDLMN